MTASMNKPSASGSFLQSLSPAQFARISQLLDQSLDMSAEDRLMWLADLERVPGGLTKLAYACGIVVWSVPRLRAQFRQGRHRARLPGVLPGRIMDAIGEQLAGTLEIDARLQHVAEMLVPQFADHCFIDLFDGDTLICRVRRHVGGWTPPPGTWKQVGELIRYPEGRFCQRAMARLIAALSSPRSSSSRASASAAWTRRVCPAAPYKPGHHAQRQWFRRDAARRPTCRQGLMTDAAAPS